MAYKERLSKNFPNEETYENYNSIKIVYEPKY